MNAAGIVRQLTEMDVYLSVRDQRLLLDAPLGVLDDGVKRVVADHKQEVLVLLRPDWRREVLAWPAEALVEWGERAALRQYDGGFDQEYAEWLAYVDMKARGATP